jgi:hypothetical protein
VDACPASYLNVELVCGVPDLQGTDITHLHIPEKDSVISYLFQHHGEVFCVKINCAKM